VTINLKMVRYPNEQRAHSIIGYGFGEIKAVIAVPSIPIENVVHARLWLKHLYL
jgi:hypothetical protein